MKSPSSLVLGPGRCFCVSFFDGKGGSDIIIGEIEPKET
jgi:hypothetical protein